MTHKNIYMALAAAQAEMGGAKKGADNPHFKSKYADLSEVVDAVKPALTKHGICYFHSIDASEMSATSMMVTTLFHGESETSIRCAVPLLVAKNDMQGFKSATTYAKRIGLESVTGIAPEDDDGNAAASAPPKTMGQSLVQAWKDGVTDQLPENATAQEKGKAFADAMVEEMAEKGTPRSVGSKNDALESYFNGRKAIVDWLGKNMPEEHERVLDAYLNRKNALREAYAEERGDLVRAAE